MPTLVTWGDSYGQRRCDAKCYGAHPGTRCDCVCGGRNHAVGYRQAVENTRAIAKELLAQGARLSTEARQLTLFGAGGDRA